MRDKIKLDIQRFANISNSENDKVITGTADADSINNDGSNVTINALEGADTIENYGSNVIIDAGAGNDTIFDGSNDVSINASVGDNYVVVSGGTVVAEGGNDTITGMNVSNINAGDGNNYVSVAGSNDLIITAGSGKDTIANYGYSSNVTINSGAGNDSVYNEGENVWIKSDSGDDSISNYGSNVTIESGDGDDYINAGSSVTINTGEGNNTVLSGSMAFVNTGSGNNIVNFSDDVTVNSGGNTRVYKEGGDTLELGADGSATLGYEVNAVNSLAAGGSWSVVGYYRSVKVGNQSFEFVNSNEFAGVLTADNSDGSKIVAISGLSGNVSVNLDSISGLKVSDNAWTISGFDNDTVNFDSTGTLATVTANADSELTIATTSNSSVNVQHDNQTLKANVNGVKVVTSENYNGWLNLQLDNSGLAGISGPFGEATIEGDNSFKVNDSFEIENIAGTTTKFSVDDSRITIRSVKDGDNYNVNGGDRTVYELAESDSAAQVSLNGEGITISSASSDVKIVSAEGDAIASITGAYLNDKITTASDKAFWVTYDTSQIDTASDDTYSIQINDAVISMKSSAVDTEELSVYVDNSSSIPHVSIYSGSIANGATLSVSAGVYYVGWREAVTVNESKGYLYLDSNGYVTAEDSSVAQIRIEREQAIAALVSSLNGGNTTVQAFKDFYNLYDNFPSTFTSTVAGYKNGSVTSPSTTATSTGVNIYGDNSLGANPEQITLQSHLSDPVNVEHAEGMTDGHTVQSAVIDVRGSKNSLVAVGMNSSESAFSTNHTILGSDEPSTIMVGAQAAGDDNYIKTGDGGNYVYAYIDNSTRHRYMNITGGAGNDTFFSSSSRQDLSTSEMGIFLIDGGNGADVFYDTSAIAIRDYNFDEGDVIVATKWTPSTPLTIDQIYLSGNRIAVNDGAIITFDPSYYSSWDSYFAKKAIIADATNTKHTNLVWSEYTDYYPVEDAIFSFKSILDASDMTSGAIMISSITSSSEQKDISNTFLGSDYADTIYAGYNDFINAGAGNDIISLAADHSGVSLALSQGMDTVYNFNVASDTIIVDSNNYSTKVEDNAVIVYSDRGSLAVEITSDTAIGELNVSVSAPLNMNNTVSGISVEGSIFNDTITNSGDNTKIYGNYGDDSISNSGSKTDIYTGYGKDTVINSGNNNQIEIDDGGAKVIINDGNTVTIEGRGYTREYGYTRLITNSGNYVYIDADSGVGSTINNTGSNSYLYAGNINSSGENNSIYGSGENSTLTIHDKNSYVNVGDYGVVILESNSSNVTVGLSGSTVYGNSTLGNIYKTERYYLYRNNVIYGFKDNDTLVIESEDTAYETSVSGNDLLVSVTAGGVITLQGASSISPIIQTLQVTQLNVTNTAADTLIVGTDYEDAITNSGSNVTIQANGGRDRITNTSNQVTIIGGKDSDYAYNTGSGVVYQYNAGDGSDTIHGFSGNDTLLMVGVTNYETVDISYGLNIVPENGGRIMILYEDSLKAIPNIVTSMPSAVIENESDNAILTGTAYDDTIINSGSNVTINALAGNDTITNTGSSIVYQYSAGDGNDVIVGFTDSDTLIISSDTYRTSISGNDLIVTVVGSENFITLKDAANLTPIIIGAEYSGYRDKDGKEIENPVAQIESGGVTYYYESVARATNDADNNSTVTVTADSTETAQINATKGLTIQFAESGLSVYSVTGGNFVSADSSKAAQFSISSNRVLSNGNSLLINNGSTVILDGYEVTGTSNGYSFALQDNVFTLNDISYRGTGTANFNTNGNVSVTSGAIITGNNEITSSTGIGLSEGNYTINGVEFSVASSNTAQTTADGVKFNLSSDTVTYNSMTFSGAGTATIQSDTGIYLTGGAVVSNVTAGQAFTFNGTGTFKLNDKTIVSSTTSLTVTNTDNGLTIGENTFSVTSDEEFTLNVDASGKIASASNINGGSTIVNAGGADSILTSSAGNFTFAQDNNKVFNIAGDDSVIFGLSSDGTVIKIADVIGTVSGDFTNAININGNAADIWIGGDNSVSVTAENKGASEIRGVSDNATVQGTGGASVVSTDEEGTFNFYDSQHITVSGESSFDFILRDSVVTGVANFENGTYFLDNTAQISVNADSLTLGFTDTATLVIADSQVVSVDGIEGYINGLTSDATVHAVGAMTVNGSNVNVSGDNDFNVIVSDGKTSGLANISSGASVSVAGMNVTTDNNGDFKVGEYVYSINDSDGSVTFITNSTGSVENIIGLNGTLKTTARNITINGGTFTTTNTDVTISSAGLNITRIDGLNSGDTIGGNLNSSTVIMPAATDTDTSVLTINERSYSLSNDSDGVSLTGNRVDGLNSGASLTVDAAGSYLVNNTALDARIGDIFIGTSEGAAYIYDPNNVPLDITNMTDEEIAAQAGVSTNYNVSETDTEKTAALLESGANFNGSMELALSNSDTTNAQTADFSNSTGVKKVTLKEGAQEIKFNDEGGNVAIIESSSAGEKNVSLGGGGDLVIVKETETPVNITAGSGKDTIVTAGNNVKVGMKGGATRIVANSGNVEVANYDASTGAGIQIDEFSDIRRAVANDNISLNNGSISFGTSTVVVNNTESESTTVNLYDNKGRKQKVAYTHNDGGKVDASGERENLLLVGNKNMDKGNANLVSGRGNDSALGGAGDYFDLGAGNNYVSISNNRGNATEGATVAVTAKEGKTEVDGFRSGFAETADKVMFDLTNAQVSFKNGKLTFDIGSASLVLNFMGNSPDLAESADLISDNNFICDTTLDDITPMTFEQGESQNWYDTTFTTASDTLSSGSEITFAGV